jgi:hypothetical protein
MRIAEAKEVAANPSAFPEKLRLAHLKLGNAALRALASSPKQKELIDLMRQIETMPRELWTFHV